MIVGDRVLFVAHWSTYHRMRGTVTRVRPTVMVRLDGDTHPMCVNEREVIAEQPSELTLTGAE